VESSAEPDINVVKGFARLEKESFGSYKVSSCCRKGSNGTKAKKNAI
jgi:hypothetical protein